MLESFFEKSVVDMPPGYWSMSGSVSILSIL